MKEPYEYCTRCNSEIETKEDCIWLDGEAFCSDSCVEEYEEENNNEKRK